MGKKIALVLGVLLVFTSFFSLTEHIQDFASLSEYGKGYIVGKVILFLAGVVLIIFSRRKPTVAPTSEEL